MKICVKVLCATAVSALVAIQPMLCFAQEAPLVSAGNDVLVRSPLIGDHVWMGGATQGRASGEGELVIFEAGSWTGRARQIFVRGEMVDGQLNGWVEAYRYQSKEYWLGYLPGFLPEGCGVAGNLRDNGGRIEESLRIEKRSRGNVVPDLYRECNQSLEKMVAKKSGKLIGKSLVSCLLERNAKCLGKGK
jgi:hypothetical protein